MEIHSVEYWQENWDELLSRVEKGEHIGVTNGKDTAIMMPADDELIRMYRDHEEGSWGTVAYWLRPTAYNGVKRVQFPPVSLGV